MKKERNHISYPFYITACVVVILLAVSFIPPFSIAGVNFKQVNILSDITSMLKPDSTVGVEIPIDTLPAVVPDSLALADSTGANIARASNVVEIEDFSGGKLDQFLTKLRSGNARIAVMGDSFTEGDIITCDIREQLQTLYGGHGIGFVTFAHPNAVNRPTVKHRSWNWVTYNVAHTKSAPANLRNKFFVSGVINTPYEGATARLSGTNFRTRLDRWGAAELYFINENNSTIEIKVNDSTYVYTPEPGPALQSILVEEQMGEIDLKIRNATGFIGYGVDLSDGNGIAVDSYPIRGNTGYQIFDTSFEANRGLGAALDYDLIILQYGLNAITSNVTQYPEYEERLRELVVYLEECFPNSAILIMGIGDRSTKRNGEFVTMPSVPAMHGIQHAVAEEKGAMFWSIYEAMGGYNSMVRWVQWNWAAKDYTHISFRGGRHIATKFVEALTGYTVIPKVESAPVYSSAAPAGVKADSLNGVPKMNGTNGAPKTDSTNVAPKDPTKMPAIKRELPDSVKAVPVERVAQEEEANNGRQTTDDTNANADSHADEKIPEQAVETPVEGEEA